MGRWEPDARGRLRAGGAGALRRARVRADDGGRDRRARGPHRAHVLPPLRRQARGAVRGLGGARRSCSCAPSPARPSAPRRSTRSPRALEAAAAVLQERATSPRQRQAVITANAELQERELIKLASLAAALAEALRERGVAEPAASLTAEVGHRGLQGRVRALDRARRGARLRHDRARVARRAARGHRRRLTAAAAAVAGCGDGQDRGSPGRARADAAGAGGRAAGRAAAVRVRAGRTATSRTSPATARSTATASS